MSFHSHHGWDTNAMVTNKNCPDEPFRMTSETNHCLPQHKLSIVVHRTLFNCSSKNDLIIWPVPLHLHCATDSPKVQPLLQWTFVSELGALIIHESLNKINTRSEYKFR